MFHDRNPLSDFAPLHPQSANRAAIEAARVMREVGIEHVNLSKKLIDNTHAMLLSAAADRDGQDVGRTMSDFVNAMVRDMSENAETVSRIWRRYLRAAPGLAAFEFDRPAPSPTSPRRVDDGAA